MALKLKIQPLIKSSTFLTRSKKIFPVVPPFHRSFYHPSVRRRSEAFPPSIFHRLSSSSSATASSAAASVESNNSAHLRHPPPAQPPALFPWHHSPHPASRRVATIIDQSALSPSFLVMETWAEKLLGLPMLSLSWPGRDGAWEDLRTEFGRAFSLGVGGVMSCACEEKMWGNEGEKRGVCTTAGASLGGTEVDLDWMRDRGKKDESDRLEDRKMILGKEASDDDSATTASSEDEKDETIRNNPAEKSEDAMDNRLLHSMVHENLVNLYLAALSPPSDLRIRLHLRPVHCAISNIFVMPSFTRELVRRDPELANILTKSLKKAGVGQDNMNITNLPKVMGSLEESLAGREGHLESMDRTVVVYASITCVEVFTVRDNNGNITQGSDTIKEVVHTVQFEMPVTGNEETGMQELGHWQITDWDDMLNGNVWF